MKTITMHAEKQRNEYFIHYCRNNLTFEMCMIGQNEIASGVHIVWQIIYTRTRGQSNRFTHGQLRTYGSQ